MGGIRKKTSKRGTTRQRAKVGKKAAETRRKNRKEAKKDVTWKTKKNQDPGIPNNFPYKDQVLAEIAEQKRLNLEAKEARRQAQKEETAAFMKGKGRADDGYDSDEDPGIQSFHDKVEITPAVGKPSVLRESDDVDTGSPPPSLIDNLLPTPQSALDRADVVIEVLDARDPQSFRSGFLENVIREGQAAAAKGTWKEKLLVVLNKADLIPKESAQNWLHVLRKELGEGKDVKVVLARANGEVVGKEAVLETLNAWADEKKKAKKQKTTAESEEDPLVAVLMGSPNVGKSSLINAILGQVARPVAAAVPFTSTSAPAPTTLSCTETRIPTEVVGGRHISLIDTPGWEFNAPEDSDDDMEEDEEDEETREARFDAMEALVAKDTLTRNLGRIDKVKDPLPFVTWIIRRANTQDLTLAYNVPYFMKGDIEAFLVQLARGNGRIRKHGDADLDSAAKIVLRDWSVGTFPYYTMPAKSAVEGQTFAPTSTDALLSTLRLTKDIKKEGKGIVRLTAGEVDARELILDEEYAGDDDESDSEDEFESADDMDAGFAVGDKDDMESGEEVEFSADEQPEVSSDEEDEKSRSKAAASKRKRLSTSSVVPPSAKRTRKGVTFAEEEMPAFDPKHKAASSAKNKRKSNGEEDEALRKRVRGGEAAVESELTEAREVKAAPKKAKAKVVKEVKETKSTAPIAAPPKPKAKVPTAVPEGEKPYDFGAHFF